MKKNFLLLFLSIVTGLLSLYGCEKKDSSQEEVVNEENAPMDSTSEDSDTSSDEGDDSSSEGVNEAPPVDTSASEAEGGETTVNTTEEKDSSTEMETPSAS